MKKLLSVFAMLAIMAAMTVSCSDDKDENGNGNNTPKDKYRVATFSLVGKDAAGATTWADIYQYTYDEQGRVTRIFREEGKDYTFTYTDGGITVTNSGNPFQTIELNEQGYAKKMTDEWGDVREFAYDSKGHMIQVKKNGTVVSEITLDTECIVSWTRPNEAGTQTKDHTYTDKPNTYGIQNIHSEATDPARWMYETGLFGKPSIYLCATSKWQHSDVTATYEYELDANGCVIAEDKNYGGEMEYFEYTWEKVE